MSLRFDIIWPSLPYILGGLWITLKYVSLSLCISVFCGSILGILKLSKNPFMKFLCSFYTSIFRGTPLLVQLALIYYATPQLVGWQIPAYTAAVLTFSLNSTAYVSEIMRGALESIDKGQWEAAKVLGIPRILVLRDIIIPQAIRRAIPSLVNEMIDLFKESALISVIGVGDLMRRAQIVASEHFLYFEPYLIVACIYYCCVMLLTVVAKILEKKLSYYA